MESININITRASHGSAAYFKVYRVFRRDLDSDHVALIATYLSESAADESARFYNALGGDICYVASDIVIV